uniref:Proton-coupled zinc antiporter SLC30A9, mitochondrial n=1 Tax=Electrophorus electricus TaxID=8005 RepID=A0A4W4HD44_ELEEL
MGLAPLTECSLPRLPKSHLVIALLVFVLDKTHWPLSFYQVFGSFKDYSPLPPFSCCQSLWLVIPLDLYSHVMFASSHAWAVTPCLLVWSACWAGGVTLFLLVFSVRAVLKKREYGSRYTQNNFITAVRAMNEFCLKLSDLEQLRKIRRRSPHDDTEAFTVFLRSDVEAKALDVWGSMEALARERKHRKEEEMEYKESKWPLNVLGPRSGKRTTFLQGPGKVVMVAICINGLNFFFKLLAWVHTGSASMFSEAIHSLADTANQALLALGIIQSVRNPDPIHPYGFTNMRYISSLISGVGIFMMGAGLSWYHGIIGLLHPHPIESLIWVSDRASFYDYVMQSRDPSTNVVLLEDAAAVLGVVLAAGCMGLTSLTGNPYYDSLGSLGVGTLLGTVSAFLIYTNTQALLGRSIQAEHMQKLTEFLESDPAVRAIHDVKATDMGLSKVRFKAEVDFDGRVVTRSYLEKQDIEQILTEIQQVKTPEELEAFMLKHGENIIDTLGAEVDRLEKELKV